MFTYRINWALPQKHLLKECVKGEISRQQDTTGDSKAYKSTRREKLSGRAPIDLEWTQQRTVETTGVSESSLRRISELDMTEFGEPTSFAAHHKVNGWNIPPFPNSPKATSTNFREVI